jgi:putative SOS response-associated peptidase YedK
MCYHYSLSKKQEEIMQMIQAEWEAPFEPIYHSIGFNFPTMPVITSSHPDKVQRYQWGLMPHWVKSLEEGDKIRTQTLNAKSETIFEKPAFRTYVNNRCIVLADGFFEWMEYKKKKYPHYVQLKSAEIFGFAGLYAHWTDKETGELLRTFTVITTDANPLMARIHNSKQRMPVILQKDQWNTWLQPDLPQEQMQALLHPCSDSNMEARTISKLITTRGTDTNVPELLQPFEYPELHSGEQFSLFDMER